MKDIHQSVETAQKELELLQKSAKMFEDTKMQVMILTLLPLLLSKSEAKTEHPELYYGFRHDAQRFCDMMKSAAEDLQKHLDQTKG